MADRPPITVTIASHDGWPVLEPIYGRFRRQAETVRAEVILVDGSGLPAPREDELASATRWIAMPGADITELRMRAYREARGEIVAMTEDHCLVPDGWIDAILRAHEEHPEAAAIGGATVNGSTRNLIDWASFYAGQSPYLAPLPRGPVPYISGVAVAYKRGPLVEALERLGDRAIETLINEELKALGYPLVADDRIMVTHLQSRGFMPTTRLHYYAGRSFEGTRQRGERGDDWVRAARAAVLPLPRVAKRVLTASRRGQPIGRVVRVAPALLWLALAQAAGEIQGALRGPGRSASRLH